jgi:hypothetical protein
MTTKVNLNEERYLAIGGQTPQRPEPIAQYKYSCLFGFGQLIQQPPETINGWNVTKNGNYYLMTGTNTEFSPIDVDVGTLLDRNQTEMHNIADRTNTLPTSVNPFTNFPFETVTGAGDARRWHPVDYFCNVEYPDAC